jgi:mRNA interferase RelE/StbE
LKKYTVVLDLKAERALKEIKDKKLLRNITNILNLLATNYLTSGKPLLGEWKGCYSIRTMRYRIIYEIFHSKQMVYILKIGHRKDVYL